LIAKWLEAIHAQGKESNKWLERINLKLLLLFIFLVVVPMVFGCIYGMITFQPPR